MKALLCHAWGVADDLKVEEAPTPSPGPGQVLIEVGATAVNYADSIMLAGHYQTKPPFPFSPGMETAGTVAACGDGVADLVPGNRVMSILPYGGMAEQTLAEASDTFRIPESMPITDAGAFPGAYLSSHVAVRWAGRLEAGESLLVLGAAGGVGLAAVEIGKALGARVIAAASTAEKLAAAEAHGADDLINYGDGDLKEQVLALTGGAGVDMAYDPVGGDLFHAALSSLAWGGRIVVVGFVGGIPQIPANRLVVKHRAVMGSCLPYYQRRALDKFRRSGQELLDWYAAGHIRPLISQCLPLARGGEGINLLTERRAHGRILILPNGADDLDG
ncbi:MAG: NADPH:quinone oxidoreductase family protein [Alphaproteobacteria bacterium]|mgnify:CR=1 FL=1|jgi:NADPH2:quinone reductase|nr:NADPH:quinone oxidoreductase family protein [Alphaproteobacteria bacterium]MDP6563214.1 NADPH:quinone oxidoreductase family protein [Alphaproteobacteria bacterium]MDP6814445.1 NADPH:quinone oxidoreductase family protein [Alphaproteobacteria bacterium]